MGTELQAAEQVDVRTIISERIKKEFVTLLPQETWDLAVNQVIDKFVNDTVDNEGRYNEKRNPSELTTIIKTALGEAVQQRAQEEVAKAIEQHELLGVGKLIEQHWQEVLLKAVGSFISQLAANLAQDAALTAARNIKIVDTCPSCHQSQWRIAADDPGSCNQCGQQMW
jgi:hypothetical protein